MPTLSVALPVEVLAHVLGWTTEVQWLQFRLLSRKWAAAVACLLEGGLTAQTSTDGVWEPHLRTTAIRRLLLVSAPIMPPEVLQSVSAVKLCSNVSEREVTVIVDHFPRLKCLLCPQTVSDTGLREIAKCEPP